MPTPIRLHACRDNVSGAEVARMTGYTVVQVSRLRRRFAEEGLAGLQDKPRSGRPPVITARKRAQVVAKTPSRPSGQEASRQRLRRGPPRYASGFGASSNSIGRSRRCRQLSVLG
jgi:homeodomain-containing protein